MTIKINGNPMIRATVAGVDGHYKGTVRGGFTEIRFYEKNAAYNGRYVPGVYEYKSELVGSVSAGNYGSPGVMPMPNRLAGQQIREAIERHAETRARKQ